MRCLGRCTPPQYFAHKSGFWRDAAFLWNEFWYFNENNKHLKCSKMESKINTLGFIYEEGHDVFAE